METSGKGLIRLTTRRQSIHSDFKPAEDNLPYKTLKIAKMFIMNKFNKARKLFGSLDFSSDSSNDSVIYISSDDETFDGWNSDWSSDTEEMVRRVEAQVQARPIPIAGRRMTTASDEPGTSTMSSGLQTTPKLDRAYFEGDLLWIRLYRNPKLVIFTHPTTYKTHCPMQISVPKDASVAWYVGNLWMKSKPQK